MSNQIVYKDGYKYQLKDNYAYQTPFIGKVTSTDFILLTTTGLLVVKKGYAWDGPSGPTLDTPNFMRGSLVHDALYQLMREGSLDIAHRESVDKLLKVICIEDGMSRLRAEIVYRMVRQFGEPSADPSIKHPLLTAP